MDLTSLGEEGGGKEKRKEKKAAAEAISADAGGGRGGMPQRQESAFLTKAAGPLPQVEDVTLCLPGTTVALQSGIQ